MRKPVNRAAIMEAAEKLTELKAYLFKTIYALQASAGVLI